MTDLEYQEMLLELEAESHEEKKKRGRKPGQYSVSVNEIEDATINPPKRNLTGQVFGRLTVTQYYIRRGIRNTHTPHIYWQCLCSCGNTKWIQAGSLYNYHTNSCGCIRREKAQFNIPNVKQYHQRLQEQAQKLSIHNTE